jgi:hypothetical protein
MILPIFASEIVYFRKTYRKCTILELASKK